MDLKNLSYEDRIEEVEEKVKKIVIEQFQFDCSIDEVDSTQDFFVESFGFTSIDALELLMRVEREFEIEIADEDLSRDLVRTIKSLSAFIADALEKQ